MDTKKEELALAAACVLADIAIEYQSGSDSTALINLCADDLQKYSRSSVETADNAPDPKQLRRIAQDIVVDGERLSRTSREFEEQALGLLMMHLFAEPAA